MKRSIKSRLKSLFDCILKKYFVGGSLEAFFLYYPPNRLPFSDAELKQCKDVLNPLGYTLTEQQGDNEIHLYRLSDLKEQEKAAELILQKLIQDV